MPVVARRDQRAIERVVNRYPHYPSDKGDKGGMLLTRAANRFL